MQVSLWWLNQANTIIESTKGFHPKSRFIQIISAVYPFSCGWEKNVSPPYLKPQMSTEFSPVNDNEDPSLRLSKREIEVLRLICQERTNQEMAAALFVSIKTIEGHRERIRYKTNTKNIAGMVLYAIKHGIFEV